jgi:oligopeptide transport system substrate-binding protein
MEKRVSDAKKLLAEAGVAPGTRLKFAYNTSETNKNVAIFISSEWKSKLGLDLELEAMEFKVLIKKRTDKDYQIARDSWVANYNDATTFLSLVQCGNDQGFVSVKC